MTEPLTLARPYARAAFALAGERQRLPHWSAQLEFAAQAVSDQRVRAVLGHPRLADVDLVALLSQDDADDVFERFLLELAENGRLPLLPEIADIYAALRAQAEQVVKARMVTASPVEAEQAEKIKAALKRRFGAEVELEAVVDPALIGGALIQAGDLIIDGSLRNKLARLRTALAQ